MRICGLKLKESSTASPQFKLPKSPDCQSNQNLSLYSLYYVEACNEFAELISASLRLSNIASFKEMSQRWRAVGSTVSDMTGSRIELHKSRSRDKRVTARPTGQSLVVNIIVDYCCTRVLLYEKMLKETETEETRLFCYILIIGGISIVGEWAHWARSLATTT